MPTEVVQVFVSSTWLDLQPERRAVEATLQRLRETKFVGMEYFGSRDESTGLASIEEVERARVYICVIAGRYGSGITEAEYRKAREARLPCFIYFKREGAISPESREPLPEQATKLGALKNELRTHHIVTEFGSPDELAVKVTADLHRWLVDEYLTPRLEGVTKGLIPREQAQDLLAAIRDTSGLDAGLLAAAREVVTASGAGAVAIGGHVSKSHLVMGNQTTIIHGPQPVLVVLLSSIVGRISIKI
jgi:hypothetical protein